MNNNIQCSIESSTTKIELNSAVDGVFLVPELEGLVGLPEIRTTSGVNAGYDGGWTSAQNYDARLISIRGVIANPDISKVEDKRRAIASLLGQGRKEQLTLRFTTEAGNAYAISVRTISCEMALQRVLTTQEFLIQLRADDPLIYDDGTTGGIAAILQPQRALGGFEINFGLPLAIGGGAEDTVVDNGNETVYPVIKLYGALHSPTVVNRTTNQQMQILADLQYSIDWHTYRSATGDYILVNDGLEGAPMTLSQLTGNAEQTTYSGKNLIKLGGSSGSASFGQTVTVTVLDESTFRLNGTATTNGWLEILDPTRFLQGVQVSSTIIYPLTSSETYTASIKLTSGTFTQSGDGSGFLFQKQSGSGSEPHANYNGTATFTGSDGIYRGWLRVMNGDTFNNAVFQIQLEKGGQYTSFEPYVGGTPAPNPSYPQSISTVTGAQTVGVTGKNLQSTTWGQDFVDAINDASKASVQTYDGKNCLKYAVSAGYGSYPAKNFTLGIKFQPNTQYTFSFDMLKTNAQARTFAIRYSDGTDTTTNAGDAGAGEWHHYEITSTAGKTVTYATPFYTAGDAYIDIDTFQIEIGTSASQFVPYCGQKLEVNLGKNLTDLSTFRIGYVDAYGGIQNAHPLGEMCSQFIKVKPNTAYTFKIFETTGTNDSWFGVGEYTSESTSSFVRRDANTTTTATSITFTTSATTNYILVSARNLEQATKVQLEKGFQATSFAPYFTPIELAKVGTYQDYIWNDGGTWKIHKSTAVAVLDGTENWAESGSTHERFVIGSAQTTFSLLAKGTPSYKSKCDYFKFQEGGTAWTGIGRCGFDGLGTFWCMISGMSSLADFKTWLGTNNVRVYYPLATPTDTEITDETLRAQLNFLASLYEGENNISLVGTGAQGEMAISYATDYTVNQDVITIDSQARTITLNGQDVYHLKTSESEFLVLAPGENKLYLTSEVSDDSGYAEVKFKQGYLSI